MNTRRSIISHNPTKSPGKIVFVLIWYECRSDLANKILILYLILISYLMNLEIFTHIFKNLNSMIPKKMSGLSNQQTVHRAKESILWMI
jgi:hypothetical protein